MNSELIIELGIGMIIAIVLKIDSIKSTALIEGDKACALIQASTDILAVNA